MCVKNRYKLLLSYILSFTLFFAAPLFGGNVSSASDACSAASNAVSMPEYVYVCGAPIGMRLKSDGLVVTGYTAFLSENEEYVNPAKKAGIMVGDRIVSVNGTKIKSAEDLAAELISSAGGECRALVERSGETKELVFYPEREIASSEYKIGVWIKDCSAGIGTITFYDKESGFFGALGHGINDSATHGLFPASGGSAFSAVISGVRKGYSGIPGELKGYFRDDCGCLGSISVNGENGVYGVLTDEACELFGGRKVPVDREGVIHPGEATIISTVDGCNAAEYKIEIEHVDTEEKGNKGISLRVTDSELIAKTGGIVQGMSGSPIIQDGYIVGAVTHVLVNDSTRGYGIVIGNMLENINSSSGCAYDRQMLMMYEMPDGSKTTKVSAA